MEDLWAKGKYVDLWSVVHTLSGVLGGVLTLLLALSFTTGLAIFVALAVLWELFEWIILHVGETWQNHVTDVIIGAAAFVIGYDIFTALATNSYLLVQISIGLGVVLALLNFLGRQAYRRRVQ